MPTFADIMFNVFFFPMLHPVVTVVALAAVLVFCVVKLIKG